MKLRTWPGITMLWWLPCAGCGPAATDDGAGGIGPTESGGATSGSGGAQGVGGSDSTGGSGLNPNGGSTAVGGTPSTGGTNATGGSNGTEALQVFSSSIVEHVLLFYAMVDSSPIDLQRLLPRPGAEEGPDCSWTEAGNCRYTEGCEYTTGPNPDAGDITLSSPDVTGSVTSSFSGGAYDLVDVTFSPGLGGGESVRLGAVGGTDLPAFDVETTFPLLVLVDSPSGDASQPISVPSNSDLTVTFRRAVGGVYLHAASRGAANTDRRFECAASGDPGSLMIPGVVLSWVGTGAQVDFYTWSVTPFQAGDQDLSFVVMTNATTDAREHAFRLLIE